MRQHDLLWMTVISLSCGFSANRDVYAQRPNSPTGRPPAVSAATAKTQPSKTSIDVKLFATSDGGGLHAQQWGKLFESMDVSLQIQRPTLNDKPEIREREVGTLRSVTVIGTLDRSGKVLFPGRTFELADGPKIKEWLDELRTYGAQGAPDGKPLWGLSKDQFNRLFDSLLKPVESELLDLTIREAIAKLPLPESYPVRLSRAADELMVRPGAKYRIRQNLRGFSAATALAVILNDGGLGFRPNRTPAGGLELLIEPLGQRTDQWPIGWPLQKQRIQAAPKFFALTTIELDQVDLPDVLTAVTELTGTPILLDYHEIEAKNIDLKSLKVSYKRGQTSWSVALNKMVVPQKLSRDVWQDEAGRAFVWITTNRPGRSAPATE
jgi:hypothetical protein